MKPGPEVPESSIPLPHVVVTFKAYPIDENTPKDREIMVFDEQWLEAMWLESPDGLDWGHRELFGTVWLSPTHWAEITEMQPGEVT